MLSSGDGGSSNRVLTLVTRVRKLVTMLLISSPSTCSRSAPIIEMESISDIKPAFLVPQEDKDWGLFMEDLMEDRVDSPLNFNQITASNCNKIISYICMILSSLICLDTPSYRRTAKIVRIRLQRDSAKSIVTKVIMAMISVTPVSQWICPLTFF